MADAESRVSPPPTIYRPKDTDFVREAQSRVADDMERLSRWMYETAQTLEVLIEEVSLRGRR